MKSTLILFLIFLISSQAYSQNCSSPLPDYEFNQKINRLSTVREDQQRLVFATEFVRKNCLVAYQVQQVAELFKDDATRLGLIEDAFASIFDKDNIYDLYDALSNFSSVMRLHDFIANEMSMHPRFNKGPENHQKYDMPDNNDRSNVPETHERRDVADHHDKSYEVCMVSDGDFQDIIASLKSQPFENSKLSSAKEVVRSKKCFNSFQIREILNLFSFEQNKLDLAKYCYAFCIDRENYYKINNCFAFPRSADDLNKFISNQN
jgi:hypothetical protein